MRNILITSAGKRVALVKAFKETLSRYDSVAKVFTTDMNPAMAPAAYVSDKSLCVPKVTDKKYPEILLKLCLDNNIGMIVPTIDTELSILAGLKQEFETHNIHVIVSDPSFISICRDKRNTCSFFERQDISFPKLLDKWHPVFPMFAKPYDGSLSANVHFIKDKEDLTTEILDDPKLLFMEYVDKSIFKEYTVDLYYGKDHCLKCAIPRERIEIRAGEINKGRTAKNQILDFVKNKLNYIEGCIGCICFQLFFQHDTQEIKGIEINPRFGGGYPLSYAAGANFPEFLLLEYFMGRKIMYTEAWKDNMLMLRYDDAIYI